ncbi:MAG: hypothetical protein FJ290_29490 [Planctomycetes bacterium]|nr:hypothetical protein [Planctomycetota bacterium]
MVIVKAKYENGKIELPTDFAAHKPCEVTVLFPDEVAPKRKLGDSEAFRRAAGGWHGLVDCEKLKRDIYGARRISTRRVPKL